MKRVFVAVTALLMLGLSTTASQAQAAGAKPKVVSEYDAVLANWNDIGRKLIAMAEDFPEDKYEFKPNPSQRTFAEQLLHASGVITSRMSQRERSHRPKRIRSANCSNQKRTSWPM